VTAPKQAESPRAEGPRAKSRHAESRHAESPHDDLQQQFAEFLAWREFEAFLRDTGADTRAPSTIESASVAAAPR
jgi:hypothetical protein